MMEVGRICMKIAGRDANNMCVVVEMLDNNYVLIDGETRRKKCNIKHLEPTNKVIKIKAGASRDEVKQEFNKLGLGFLEPKAKHTSLELKKLKLKKKK
jgi:large subunit ribosomal protein L14e